MDPGNWPPLNRRNTKPPSQKAKFGRRSQTDRGHAASTAFLPLEEVAEPATTPTPVTPRRERKVAVTATPFIVNDDHGANEGEHLLPVKLVIHKYV